MTPEDKSPSEVFIEEFNNQSRLPLLKTACEIARNARLEALEEAAKIAESIPYVRTLTPNPGAHEAITAAQTEIAAAIRERAKA